MGQKINPNILRLTNTNNWDYQYSEKNSFESLNYTFKNIEIENFINMFLKLHGLTAHKIKIYHFNSILHILISYYAIPKTTYKINLNHKNIKLILEQNQITKKYIKTRIKIKKNIKKYKRYKTLNYINNISYPNKKNNINIYKKKSNIKRISLLNQYNQNLLTNNYKNISNIKKNYFLEIMLESLTLFLKKNISISLTLKQLNNNIKQKVNKKEQKIIKKNLIKLRKYNKNQFFKEGVNILFNCVTNLNSATLLAKFIAKKLQNLKRHNFFLKFIKTTLTLFFNKTFSKCKGIKIKIKGRFNGAPRARDKSIFIGNSIPTLTIDSNISYGEETAFTPNGTFGVKVWVNERKNVYRT